MAPEPGGEREEQGAFSVDDIRLSEASDSSRCCHDHVARFEDS